MLSRFAYDRKDPAVGVIDPLLVGSAADVLEDDASGPFVST